MNLNHLRAFVAVAESLNFSRAADRMHVSQPALSNQIRLLEEDLGATLFIRNRRTVSLSPAGRDVLEDAQRLLATAEEIRQRLSKASSGSLGTLRIGFVASATAQIIPRITISFRKNFPDVSLELRNIPTVPQLDALRENRLDVGIVRMPLRQPDIEVLPIYSECFALVASKQGSLRGKQTLSVPDLEQEPFVSYSERLAPEFFQHWTGICRKAGFTPRIFQEVAEMETAMALVSAGVGVAIVPEGVAKRYKRSVHVVPLRQERIRSEIGLAFLRRNPPPVVKRFVASVAGLGLLEKRPVKR